MEWDHGAQINILWEQEVLKWIFCESESSAKFDFWIKYFEQKSNRHNKLPVAAEGSGETSFLKAAGDGGIKRQSSTIILYVFYWLSWIFTALLANPFRRGYMCRIEQIHGSCAIGGTNSAKPHHGGDVCGMVVLVVNSTFCTILTIGKLQSKSFLFPPEPK